MTDGNGNFKWVDKWGDVLKLTLGFITCAGFMIGGLWFIFEPRIEKYLELRGAETKTQLLDNAKAIEKLSKSISILSGKIKQSTLPFIQFIGAGVVVGKEPFLAGTEIRFVYQLRRNSDCDTIVEIQFLDESLGGGINQSLSYTVIASRSPIMLEYSNFAITIKLPEHMPSGRYAYAPILRPKNDCKNYEAVHRRLQNFLMWLLIIN